MSDPMADWNCDGTQCSCHDPTMCADCGCLHNETDPDSVLVNAERLRRAYCKVKHGGEHQVCDSYNADAIFAAIQEQKP